MGDLRARAKAAINSFIATPLDFTTRVNGALGFKKPGQNHKVGKMKAKSQLDFTTRVKKTPMSLFLFGNLVTNFFL